MSTLNWVEARKINVGDIINTPDNENFEVGQIRRDEGKLIFVHAKKATVTTVKPKQKILKGTY